MSNLRVNYASKDPTIAQCRYYSWVCRAKCMDLLRMGASLRLRLCRFTVGRSCLACVCGDARVLKMGGGSGGP